MIDADPIPATNVSDDRKWTVNDPKYQLSVSDSEYLAAAYAEEC